MIVRKNLKWSVILRTSWIMLVLWLTLSTLAYILFFRFGITAIAIPFAPVGVLGTALSIFLGFRNSSSYDRWWEARKIWGGIVNNSRTFARQVISLSSLKDDQQDSGKKIHSYRRDLVYRHLAWINALRLQLRQQNQKEVWEKEVLSFLKTEDIALLENAKNKATQLIMLQAKQIADGTSKTFFDDFRHIQLDNTLTEFYNLQGQAERIKNTPLPRQYDYFNRLFMQLFVFLLPFSLLEIFTKSGLPVLMIPLTVLTGFVFYVVESVGRRNEDPFENKITDTPMTALCCTIEIDLKQMLGETKLPEKMTPIDGFLF